MAVSSLAMLAIADTSAGTIDTTSSWSTSAFSAFGEGPAAKATFGQTFTVVEPDTTIDSMTFWINDIVDPDDVDFSAYLMEWDASNHRANGPILYESGMQSTTNNGALGGWEAFTFSLGGVPLISGKQYVAFLSASDYFDNIQGTSNVGGLATSVYSGGGFVSQNNGADFSQLTNSAWIDTGAWELAFRAEFSSASAANAPEPSSLALFGIGFICLAIGGNRVRRARGRSGERVSTSLDNWQEEGTSG